MPYRRPRCRRREHGAAAILAMMFLLIFGSLAAAMAIVSQGNLRTADTHLKINRALATAETGMDYIAYRLDRVTLPTPGDENDRTVFTTDGKIDPDDARELWLAPTTGVMAQLKASLANDAHILGNSGPVTHRFSIGDINGDGNEEVCGVLETGEIQLAPDGPTFTATLIQHPIPYSAMPSSLSEFKEHYGAAELEPQPGEPRAGHRYNVAPYDGTQSKTGIHEKIYQAPGRRLDGRFVRVHIKARTGQGANALTRTISMDFRIDKRIPYAILSRSRLMIGQNVNIDGPIGSRFIDTDQPDGEPAHPIQMVSDFRGLDSDLSSDLDNLQQKLTQYDTGTRDNRINLSHPLEKQADLDAHDENGDGYVDGYDYFLAHYDTNGDDAVSMEEFNSSDDPQRTKLFELMNRWATPNDGNPEVINLRDQYAKVNGEVHLRVSKSKWEGDMDSAGYQTALEGSVRTDPGETPINFNSEKTENYQFAPSDLNFNDFASDTESIHANHSPATSPPAGHPQPEAVPYGAENPYDYYDRPVYVDQTFEDVRIPAGTNALFVNCTFIGVTYVNTYDANTMENFNLAGAKDLASGELFDRYPGKTVTINGEVRDSSKPFANNLRFHGCDFHGSIVTDTPQAFTHVRNKLTFTGDTEFRIDESQNLTEEEKARFRRSRLLAPHFSVELGRVSPIEDGGSGDDGSTGTEEDDGIDLTGTIIAGIIDMRGLIDVRGTIVTTYEPTGDGEGPVEHGLSPWFNTTLGYFSNEAGDKEAGSPGAARGRVHLQYDPTIPLPDGINGPIELMPLRSTYREGG
jgi:hypothetical protein